LILRRLLGGRPDAGRPLTAGETMLAEGMFGASLDTQTIRLHHARWFAFQPRRTVMAPDGHIWFVPGDGLWHDDFATAPLPIRRMFLHELLHCWQYQRGLCLIVRRHPFCRYGYTIVPGRPLTRYGIEQQAVIVEDCFAARVKGKPDAVIEALLADAGIGDGHVPSGHWR
jgi:hypothetical protein